MSYSKQLEFSEFNLVLFPFAVRKYEYTISYVEGTTVSQIICTHLPGRYWPF